MALVHKESAVFWLVPLVCSSSGCLPYYLVFKKGEKYFPVCQHNLDEQSYPGSSDGMESNHLGIISTRRDKPQNF